MKTSILVLVAVGVLGLGVVQAEAIPFDLTLLGSEGLLGSSGTTGGVTATAYKAPKPTFNYVTSLLFLRNDFEDHGLGVCSEGLTSCLGGGGDVNELSNQKTNELIRLTRPDNMAWTALWVSSLDGGGTNGQEKGLLTWSNNADPNGARLGSFAFGFGNFGSAVEGNLFALSAFTAAFSNANAKYLFFTPSATNGTNNDYLVWKGATEIERGNTAVPEPASLLLLGSGLLGAAARRRRKQHSAK